MFIVVVIAIWLVALAIWWISSRALRHSDVDKIKSRLLGTAKTKKAKAAGAAPTLIRPDQKTGYLISRLTERFQFQPRLQEMLEQAGLRWHATRLMHACLAMFLVCFGLGWFMIPVEFHQLAWIPALVGGALPLLFVMRKRSARMKRFEELFPESLEFVARSMRAGHAFSVSLEMIHREFQEPLSGEFRRTFEEHNLGLPLDSALQKLAKRVPLLDVHFFVSAVLLQKRTGGNLAEILDKLAYVIRERFKLRGRIKAISAHGRMTGIALTCIPVAVGVMMFYVNPDYIRFFFQDEVGHYMFGGAILLQCIGYGVIRKIVKIEV